MKNLILMLLMTVSVALNGQIETPDFLAFKVDKTFDLKNDSVTCYVIFPQNIHSITYYRDCGKGWEPFHSIRASVLEDFGDAGVHLFSDHLIGWGVTRYQAKIIDTEGTVIMSEIKSISRYEDAVVINKQNTRIFLCNVNPYDYDYFFLYLNHKTEETGIYMFQFAEYKGIYSHILDLWKLPSGDYSIIIEKSHPDREDEAELIFEGIINLKTGERS